MKFSIIAVLALASFAAAADTLAVGNPVVLLCKINAIRAKRGLEPLGLSEKLVTATSGHAADQAKMNRITNTGSDGSGPADRARRAKFNYQWIGELVGGGYRNEDELLSQFMADGSMRDYILNKDVELFGSGFARNKQDYPFWALNFGRDWFGRSGVPDCRDVAPVPRDLEALDEDVVYQKAASPIVTSDKQ